MQEEFVLIADDHPVFRIGLRNLIEMALPQAHLVEAHSMDEVLEQIERMGEPTLLVLDFVFPGLDPQSTLADLRQLIPRTSIIVVSMLEDEKAIEQMIEQGADAFISKSIPADEMLAAIMQVRGGELVVKLSGVPQPPPSYRILPNSIEFSTRQQEILSLVREGLSNKEIARTLSLSPFTVRNHLSRIMLAVGVSTRSDLVSLPVDKA